MGDNNDGDFVEVERRPDGYYVVVWQNGIEAGADGPYGFEKDASQKASDIAIVMRVMHS